jgi:hypothetical protein
MTRLIDAVAGDVQAIWSVNAEARILNSSDRRFEL